MRLPHQDACIYEVGRIKILLLISVFFIISKSFSQQIHDSENLSVTPFTNENGLRQSMVSQVCQDQQGLIWAVTGDGLHYFDGQEFKAFRVPYNDVYNQTDNVMRFLVSSGPGELTLTSNSSLLQFNSTNAKFKIVYRKEGIYPIVLNTTIDKCPLIFIRGLNFCLLKNNRLITLKFVYEQNAESLPEFVPINSIQSGRNEILITGEQGILVLQLNSRLSDSVFKVKRIPLPGCRNAAKTSKGKIFVLAGNKIYTWQKDGNLSLYADTKLEGVQNMFVDSKENIWLTDKTANKIYRFTEGSIREINLYTHIGKSAELLKPNIIDIFEDREHNIWFGTDGNGLLLHSPGQVQFQKANIGFVRCLTAFNKNIWAGTFNNGLWELSPDLSKAERIRASHFGNTVYFLDFTADNSGRLWIATRNGLEVVNEKGENLWTYPFQCLHAKFISKGGDSILLVYDNQLLRFKSSVKPVCYRSDKYIAARALLKVNGNYWVGTAYGLYRYSEKLGFNQSLAFLPAEHKLSSIPVYGMLFHDGLIWIASGNGVSCYNQDGTAHKLSGCFNELKNDVIYSILADDLGRFWITGNNGIGCISPAEDRIMFFNSKNNLQSLEFNHNASYSSAGDNLYFGGIQGLNQINPGKFKPDKDPPVVQLISLFVSDTAYSPCIPEPKPEFKLSRLAPHISGKVFSTDYANSGSLLYSYYLEGYQSTWSKPSNNAAFTYRNLPPGDYRLFVKCADTYMNWSNPSQLLYFSISPAYYTTWWFMVLFSILILGITTFVVKRIQQVQYQERIRIIEREFAIEKERLRISKDMHDEVGASLTRISILSELAKKQQNEPEKERQIINQISEISGDVVDEMSEIIWAMNPRNDTFDSFTSYIRQYASSYLESAGIKGVFSFPEQIPLQPMSSELRRNLFLTVKEALHNIVKHSGASTVHMSLNFDKQSLRIKIEDDGKGFDPAKIRGWGNGLTNMRKRLEELEGTFEISPEEGKGTKVEFAVSLNQKDKSH
jgi:signal transduction histidine kinase/ligand-binding sensor domain-containing protein